MMQNLPALRGLSSPTDTHPAVIAGPPVPVVALAKGWAWFYRREAVEACNGLLRGIREAGEANTPEAEGHPPPGLGSSSTYRAAGPETLPSPDAP